MNVVDRERIEQLATTLRRHANDLVSAHNALRAVAAASEWHSPAGRTFATSLHGTLLLIHSAANRAGHTADALDRHGRCAAQRAHALQIAAKLAVPIVELL
jgi:hypothetical protein